MYNDKVIAKHNSLSTSFNFLSYKLADNLITDFDKILKKYQKLNGKLIQYFIDKDLLTDPEKQNFDLTSEIIKEHGIYLIDITFKCKNNTIKDFKNDVKKINKSFNIEYQYVTESEIKLKIIYNPKNNNKFLSRFKRSKGSMLSIGTI